MVTHRMNRRELLLLGAASIARAGEVGLPLSQISQERRRELADNPHGLSAEQLNAYIPEIERVSIDNSLSSAAPSDELRLIAWNMERGRAWREGVELIREHPALRDPDVIFLGEMDLGMARSANEHTTAEMARALGMNYAYGVEFLELTGGEEEERRLYPGENTWGYHGNAILSKRPLEGARIVRFPGIEKWYGHYQNRLGGRMALVATMVVGMGAGMRPRLVTLVSAHLESGREAYDIGKRRSEMDLLLAELEGYGTVLLGGDLNTIPTDPLFDAMRAKGFQVEELNDLASGTAQEIGPGGEIVMRDYHIDYLCARGVEAVDGSPAVVPAAWRGKFLADHALVAATVRLAENPPYLG